MKYFSETPPFFHYPPCCKPNSETAWMSSHLSGRLPLQHRPSVFSRPRQAVRHQRLLQTPPGLVNLQLLFPASAERHTATGQQSLNRVF